MEVLVGESKTEWSWIWCKTYQYQTGSFLSWRVTLELGGRGGSKVGESKLDIDCCFTYFQYMHISNGSNENAKQQLYIFNLNIGNEHTHTICNFKCPFKDPIIKVLMPGGISADTVLTKCSKKYICQGKVDRIWHSDNENINCSCYALDLVRLSIDDEKCLFLLTTYFRSDFECNWCLGTGSNSPRIWETKRSMGIRKPKQQGHMYIIW